jgi:CheY-like chemotaxis protein/DNA-binding XRE family transcriptional regulator
MRPVVNKKNGSQVPASDTDIQIRLGLAVRAYRQRLGITQEELAWRASMHRTYIADIERGARNVTLRSVVNLAKALEVTVGSLLSHPTSPADTPSPEGAGKEGSSRFVREILLVEDNALDADLAVRVFKRSRITNPLRIVRSAEEGLDFLFGTGRYATQGSVQPHLILLDLNLPEMSGLDFLRRVKSDERTHHIPVVVLTVSQSDRMIIECSRLGTESYIIKPLGIESFVRVTPKLKLQLTIGPIADTP